MRWSSLRRTAAMGMGLAVLTAAAGALAQVPPYPPAPAYPPPPAYTPVPPPVASEAGEIAACLCLNREVGALSAELSARQQAYNAAQGEVARLDAELQRARARIDVNNPQSVAEFRQLLARRDTAFRRQTGSAFTSLSEATAHYNARINQYNAQCANRPQNPEVIARVQATLACPAPR